MSRPAGISGSLPFRLGTTSYILHDDILPNVEYLKDKVDDIELVLFESARESDIPSPDVIGKLASYAKDWNLTYTVHLPYDVRAGSADEKERRHAVETWIKVIDRTKSLPVHAFIAHLNPEKCDGPSDVDKWMTRLEKTLDELKSGAQDMIDTSLICIENLKGDYNVASSELAQKVQKLHKFVAVCLVQCLMVLAFRHSVKMDNPGERKHVRHALAVVQSCLPQVAHIQSKSESVVEDHRNQKSDIIFEVLDADQ